MTKRVIMAALVTVRRAPRALLGALVTALLAALVTVLVTALFAVLLMVPGVPRAAVAQGAPADLPRVTLPERVELIYSKRADDPWNTIFYYLFSRRLTTRVSAEFPEGAPFRNMGMDFQVSERVFEKDEVGDQPVDPMYPTFFVGYGGMIVLRDPAYEKFVKALRAALDDNSPRSPVARALMQSDLWGAYDALFNPFLPDDEKALGERRKAALDLIGRLMRKVALTPEEIRALPENLPVAAREGAFPDVFGKDSGWVEVNFILPREHDLAAGYRRATRVFLKPASGQRDVKKFLNSLPDDPANVSGLDGAALVIQLILIDAHGELRPTRVTVDAQARMFERGADGKSKATVKVCEVRRKLFAENPGSGGMVTVGEDAPAYFGGYGFAEGQFNAQFREPVQVKLRTRCGRCHDQDSAGDLKLVRSFAIIRAPHEKVPPVVRLNPAATDVADFDIAKKRGKEEFRALVGYFR